MSMIDQIMNSFQPQQSNHIADLLSEYLAKPKTDIRDLISGDIGIGTTDQRPQPAPLGIDQSVMGEGETIGQMITRKGQEDPFALSIANKIVGRPNPAQPLKEYAGEIAREMQTPEGMINIALMTSGGGFKKVSKGVRQGFGKSLDDFELAKTPKEIPIPETPQSIGLEDLKGKIPKDLSQKTIQQLLDIKNKSRHITITNAIDEELTNRGYFKQKQIGEYYEKIKDKTESELLKRKSDLQSVGGMENEIQAIDKRLAETPQTQGMGGIEGKITNLANSGDKVAQKIESLVSVDGLSIDKAIGISADKEWLIKNSKDLGIDAQKYKVNLEKEQKIADSVFVDTGINTLEKEITQLAERQGGSGVIQKLREAEKGLSREEYHSKLKEVWSGLQKKGLPALDYLGIKIKSPTPSPLLDQAKGMSKEEWVNKKLNVYHGSKEGNLSEIKLMPTSADKLTLADPSKSYGDRGYIFLAKDKKISSIYGKPQKIAIDENAKILDPKTDEGFQLIKRALPDESDGFIRNQMGTEGIDFSIIDKVENPNQAKAILNQLKKEGYDGIKVQEYDLDGNPSGSSIAIHNLEKIKTKSQLESIWNEANKGNEGSISKNIKSLIKEE